MRAIVFSVAAALGLASAGPAAGQYFYSNAYAGGSQYPATIGAPGVYRPTAGATFGGGHVGPAPYTFVQPFQGYSVAPNTGVQMAPQFGSRVTPRNIRYVPYGTTPARNPNRTPAGNLRPVAATTADAQAPEAKADAEGFVTVPREKADGALQPAAASVRGFAAGGVASPSAPAGYQQPRSLVRPLPYQTPLRAMPRNAVRSAYATPTQSRDGKADWGPIAP